MQLATPNVDLYTIEDYRNARRKLARVAGLATVGLSALVYLLTFSPGVFPGESASLMSIYSGLEPLVSPAHSIWG
ncbi:MAG: hypothetical protein IJP66_02355, partial [Kiritimatiellae bacterium]|nr:hypothetical protein [Kiritimatiellia bacterium]